MTKTNSSSTSSRLSKVKRQRLAEPLRYLFYSAEGVGKSTLAAAAPEPIFMDIEDGTARLDVARYPFHDGRSGHLPQTYADVLAGIEDLRDTDHGYKTLVIDTVDRLETLLWDGACEYYSGTKDEAFNKKGGTLESIESFGYGKGYTVALQWWHRLCSRLDALRRERDMGIILLGHATIRPFKNPSGADFDRYQLRLHDKAGGFLREWCDVVGFAAFEDAIRKENDRARAKAYETGARLLHFERTASYDAKTRVPLPAELELDIAAPWAALSAALEEGRSATPEEFREQIRAELERINDVELEAKVNTALENTGGDTLTLSRYLNNLRSRPAAEIQE